MKCVEDRLPPIDYDTADLDRPSFRGCVFCYTAEMSVSGVRKAARLLCSD